MGSRRRTGLALCALGALTGCFDPQPPQGLPCTDDHRCPDGQTCDLATNVCGVPTAGATWRDDSAADFAQPGAVLVDAVVEASGAVGPRPYLTGAWRTVGIPGARFASADAATWAAIAGAPTAGRGFMHLAGFDVWTDAPRGVDLTATNDVTVAFEGEIYLEAGSWQFYLWGDDVAFVPDNYSYGSDEAQWRKQERGDDLLWHIADDRQMYRPGEDVHLKGWLRVRQGKKGGDVAGLAGAVTGVRYKVVDPIGNQLFAGTAKVSTLGGFDLAFTLPKTPNLGYASIELEANGRVSGSAEHDFRIQEFRRPEYEVSAKADDAIKMIGGSADVTVQASYFAGGGLAGAEVNWYLTASETTFTPPNRDDFTFGKWVPWWGWGRRWWDDGGGYQAPQSWNHQGKTDATGAHVLHLDFLGVNPPVPMSVNANASVTDVNRQEWASETNVLVHPASLYVGLRGARTFVREGEPLDIDDEELEPQSPHT